VWGLVHSKRKKDVGEGLQLAGALMESDELEDERKKDLVYIKCVALYKLGGVSLPFESVLQLNEGAVLLAESLNG